MSGTDPSDMIRDDMEKFQRMRGDGSMDTSIPAMMEVAFASLFTVTALAWFVAIFWVPDPIPGEAWLGLGGLAMVLFGVPAGAIYVLRRGGGAVIMALIREYAG